MSCQPIRLRWGHGGIHTVKKIALSTIIISIICVSATVAQTKNADIRQIDALVKAIDVRIKRPKAAKLVFADVSNYEADEAAKWQQFASEKALERHREKSEAYTIAYVWLEAGKPVSTNFTLFSPSGDWVKYVYSYFRPDGSLARVETDYRTFMGDFKVVRHIYFDAAGKEISRSAKFLDLQTGKPKKMPEGGVMGDDPDEVDYYMTVAKLPFANLIKKK
jgi:hypothetical protein